MNSEKFYSVLGLAIMFAIGVVSHILYTSLTNERQLDGFLYQETSYDTARAYADSQDPRGDWICVNVKGMEYDHAVQVCQHEVGHEIFAEYCEDHIDECIEVASK